MGLEPSNPWGSGEQRRVDNQQQGRPITQGSGLFRKPGPARKTGVLPKLDEEQSSSPTEQVEAIPGPGMERPGPPRVAEPRPGTIEKIDTLKTPSVPLPLLSPASNSQFQVVPPPYISQPLAAPPVSSGGQKLNLGQANPGRNIIETFNTVEMPHLPKITAPLLEPRIPQAPILPETSPSRKMRPGKALLLIALLSILLFQAANTSFAQFLGPQGWAYVLGGPAKGGNNLLQNLNPGKKGQNSTATAALTPDQYIDLVISRMSLDQKLGQMMMVQFTGPDYSFDLSTMINQYHVGAVLLLAGNGNILGEGSATQIKDKLTNLTQQMQQDSTRGLLPLTIALDQEGGEVDRLQNIDGPRPSAAEIGATGDPNKAQAAGQQDAQDLATYGINLNLAPVVDVGTLASAEVVYHYRTYGRDPATVSSMAAAYLRGLQQSGKVLGTLKHFPNLGAATGDPHSAPTYLYHKKDLLEQEDWAPYRTLIQQGLVHAILVTHEFVPEIDSTKPASLSPKLVQGILRDEMGFQGVIMTDSVSMGGLRGYTQAQAAALAVEAGSDIIMGASSPNEVASMIDGIQQEISNGTISQQRIDQSVHRILKMKYDMGLISIPKS